MATFAETTKRQSIEMMSRLPLLILGILLFTLTLGLKAQDAGETSKYGERPHDGVFDPTDSLLPVQRKEISEPLGRLLENEGVDILVVILPEIGDAPIRHVAKGFRDEWASESLNAIVLHVIGHQESPWIFPGDTINRVVKSEKLADSIQTAESRARSEPTEFARIRAASIEAADIMRYWIGGAAIGSEALISERLSRKLAFEKRERLIKLAAMIGLAGAIPLIFGVVFFITMLKKRGARNFPLVRKTPRLGAPYAGGGKAMSNIKKPHYSS